MSDEKTLNVLAHILGLISGFIGPLIIFLVAEGKPKDHARVALNWQFSFLIYYIASFILMFVLIGFLFIPVLIVLYFVFPIVGSVKASKGEIWKYPLSIPFFKV